MATTEQVFNTPELLSSILVNLDQRNLLTVAQLVCKAWFHEINSTPCLTRHLFFNLPISSPTPGNTSSRILNPILSEAFPPFYELRVDQDVLVFEEEEQEEHNWMALEPSDQFKLTKLFAIKDPDQNPFLREAASWLRMHVSDPPTTRIAIHQSWNIRGTTSQSVDTTSYPFGLRMGDLYGFMLKWSAHGRIPRWRVVWPEGGLFTCWSPAGKDEGAKCQLLVKLEDNVPLLQGRRHQPWEVWNRSGYEFFQWTWSGLDFFDLEV